jgi:hypothetical protein
MAGEVIFRVSAEEAQVFATITKIIDAAKRGETAFGAVGQAASKSARESKTEFDGMERSVAKATHTLTSLAAVFGVTTSAVGMLSSAFQAHEQLVEKSIQKIKEFQEAYRTAAFNSEGYADPGFRQKILDVSKASGMAPDQIAAGMSALRGVSGGMGADRQGELMAAMIRLSKTSDVPLDKIAGGFAKMAETYPGLTPVEISNISRVMMDQRGMQNGVEVAGAMPDIMAAGRYGNMDARAAAAMAATLARVKGSPGEASAAMRQAVVRVMMSDPEEEAAALGAFGGDIREERKKMLSDAGVTEKDDAYTRVLKLGKLYDQGKIGKQELTTLFGPRGAMAGEILLKDRSYLQQQLAGFNAQTGPGQDVVSQRLGTLMANDPISRALSAGNKIDAGAAAAMQRPENLYWDNVFKAWDRAYAEGKVNGLELKLNKAALTVDRFINPSGSWSRGTKTEADNAVDAIRDLLESKYGMNETDAYATARIWAGMDQDPNAASDLQKAAKNLLEASNGLKSAVGGAPAVNAQTLDH